MVVTQDGGEPGLSRENLRAAAGGTTSTVSQTARDKNLVFGSINVMRSRDRVHGLMRHIKTMDRHFDIVCLQDPPLELPFISTPDYSMWYDAGRELTEDDNPAEDNNPRNDTLKTCRVAFLVHEDLRIVDWRVKPCTNHNSLLIATLHFATVMGDIHAHNVYNWKQTLDIDESIETCTGQGAHLIFGDFNEHNRAWTNKGEPTTRAAAKKLWSCLQANDMKLLNTPGVPTYYRSADPNGISSTIDLVFASPAIASREPWWEILDVPGFKSDHRVLQTTLALEPIREIWSRANCKRVNKHRVRAAAKHYLSFLDHTSALDTPAKIQKYFLDLVHSLKAAITEAFPRPKPRKTHADRKGQLTFLPALDKARISLGRNSANSTT